MDVNSGCSSLVGCATIKWMHYSDSSKGGSNEFLNLAEGPVDRLTCHFEVQRRYLSDKKWFYLVYTLSYEVETARIGKKTYNLQFFMLHKLFYGVNGSVVGVNFAPYCA